MNNCHGKHDGKFCSGSNAGGGGQIKKAADDHFDDQKHEIVKQVNSYTRKDQHVLYVNNERHVTVSDKGLAALRERNISLTDSEGIKKYLKYNNL